MVNTTAQKRFPGLYFPMGLTAEIVAERYKISREDQDQYALQSQQRYAKAVEEGKVAEDIVPMKVRRQVIQKDKEPYDEDFTVEHDECNRPDTTLEGLAKLPARVQEGRRRAAPSRRATRRSSPTARRRRC